MILWSCRCWQVNGYAAAHGMRYGMITNLLWSWVFVMDGCNNMKVSAAYRYDAIQPTILQVSARALRCMYIHSAAAHMPIGYRQRMLFMHKTCITSASTLCCCICI